MSARSGDDRSSEQRSETMRRVKSQNTTPEMAVRRLIHSLGYRYRLHSRKLPGVPDLVFSSRRKVIFVHGCFWHRHAGCRNDRPPNSRREYWEPKLARNVRRDSENQAKLSEAGWRVLVIWDCEVKQPNLEDRITAFLGAPRLR